MLQSDPAEAVKVQVMCSDAVHTQAYMGGGGAGPGGHQPAVAAAAQTTQLGPGGAMYVMYGRDREPQPSPHPHDGLILNRNRRT